MSDNIVPRENEVGSLGTSSKQWNEIRGKEIYENGTRVATANNVPPSIGSADTPVYIDANGVITSTGKSFSSYLPLSGGTMTGDITLSGERVVKNSNSTGSIGLMGGYNASTGAFLLTYGKTHSLRPGCFVLASSKSDGTRVDLVGKPDGTLTWGGNNVLTTATVGLVYSNSATLVSLVANTGTEICKVSLSAGVWIVTGHVRYTSITNANIYGIIISTSSGAYTYASDSAVAVHSSSSENIALQTVRVISLPAAGYVYLNGYATAAVTAHTVDIHAIRII